MTPDASRNHLRLYPITKPLERGAGKAAGAPQPGDGAADTRAVAEAAQQATAGAPEVIDPPQRWTLGLGIRKQVACFLEAEARLAHQLQWQLHGQLGLAPGSQEAVATPL